MLEMLRPPGLSEQDLEEMRRIRMQELVNGVYTDSYDDWVLAGQPKESFNPSVAVAFFPMPARDKGERVLTVFVPQVAEFVENHDPVITYWRRIKDLRLPQRALDYEAIYFREEAQVGDQVMKGIIPDLAMNLMPTAMVAFSRREQQIVTAQDESAFLFCPRLIPPTATFRHLQLQVQAQLERLSLTM